MQFVPGHSSQSQFRILLPNRETRWLEARGTPSPSGSHWRGVVMDITTRKNAEIAVLRSEKLAAIGRLSATVAHEINNPLEAATNLIYLASLDTAMSAEARAYLADAERELHRLANIARHTLTFARTKPTGGPTEIGPIIESVVAMFGIEVWFYARQSTTGATRSSLMHSRTFLRRWSG